MTIYPGNPCAVTYPPQIGTTPSRCVVDLKENGAGITCEVGKLRKKNQRKKKISWVVQSAGLSFPKVSVDANPGVDENGSGRVKMTGLVLVTLCEEVSMSKGSERTSEGYKSMQ